MVAKNLARIVVAEMATVVAEIATVVRERHLVRCNGIQRPTYCGT